MRMLRRCWWDDWLMVAAAICCCGVTVSVILATQEYGWNNHVWDLHTSKLVAGRKVSIAGQTIFVFASGLSKLSILVSYLRIASKGSLFHRLTWITIAIVGAAIPAFLLLLWLQCLPASSYWILLPYNRDCIPEGPPLMGQTIVTVITDFMVYILPMPLLWALDLPVTQRVSLTALFGMGSVVVVAGCMRTYWVHYVEYETYDVTWEGFNLWIWAAVEVNLGVICGSVPVLKPLLWPSQHRMASYPKAKSSSLGYTTGGTATTDRSARRSRIPECHISPPEPEADGPYVALDDLEFGARERAAEAEDPWNRRETFTLPIERPEEVDEEYFQQERFRRQHFRREQLWVPFDDGNYGTGLSPPPHQTRFDWR
ncbi:hypothetical protein F4780DRAFT_154397 [Xylariomycetidae sp. FL0641]|nr:hypothetical protein F4780DRAFT_154397 [Xylariomycetidae sp. FL0641]